MPSILHVVAKDKHKRRELINIKRRIQINLSLAIVVSAFLIYFVTTLYSYFVTSNDILQEFDFLYASSLGTNGKKRILLQTEEEPSNEFPNSIFSESAIANGVFLLYLIGMLYTFVGIAIICDDYFVPTLEVIVDKLHMTPDTAGATWLAAGGSAPELFTSFIGTFIAHSDVGFGTIIGSAVFNVLFVIGVCAIVTPGNLPLTCWPFARDMTYYLISLAVLAIFFGVISKHIIKWWESVILLCLYLIYVLLMSQNDKLHTWVSSKLPNFMKHDSNQLLVDRKTFPGTEKYFQDEEDDDAGPDISWPSSSSIKDQIVFLISVPLIYPIYFTLVDITHEENRNWWVWTFVGSLVWLGILSYLMVWWAIVIGEAWSIPDELMGIVFLAAGTSVPELFTCVIVAKKGEADMAVSGSIGSNIFDILVGLPLPWLSFSIVEYIKGNNAEIEVGADNLFLSLLILVVFICSVLFVIIWNKWTMTTKLGVTMIALYCLFVAQDLVRHFAGWNVPF